ncbi:DUF3265 domain-containing protein [Vibrio splendidus]|nr:DUF3265 domain-containing protein [Vibrio splendidus]
MTNCLRVIRNAWRFYYALRLVFKVVCGGIGLRCPHLNRATWIPPVVKHPLNLC